MSVEFTELTANEFAEGLGFFGAVFALGLIPTWVAIFRKHKKLGWFIAANIVSGIVLSELPGAFVLVWIALLAWAIISTKKPQPQTIYYAPQQYQPPAPPPPQWAHPPQPQHQPYPAPQAQPVQPPYPYSQQPQHPYDVRS